MFQCTFCLKQISAKSWKRHETFHLPRFQWICVATGIIVQSTHENSFCCDFCNEPNPSPNYSKDCYRTDKCAKKAAVDSTFMRRVHLKQHILRFHGCAMPDNVANCWRSKISYSQQIWTCEFCGDSLESWDARAIHILKHFREGKTMNYWNSSRSKPAISQARLKRSREDPSKTLSIILNAFK